MSKKVLANRNSERGGASLKFLIVALILIVAVNAGYNFIPTAYQGESFKEEMESSMMQAMAMSSNAGAPTDVLKAKLVKLATADQLPPAYIDVRQVNNVLTARVAYTKEVSVVPFGIYNYKYQFDHTVTPSGFLMKGN